MTQFNKMSTKLMKYIIIWPALLLFNNNGYSSVINNNTYRIQHFTAEDKENIKNISDKIKEADNAIKEFIDYYIFNIDGIHSINNSTDFDLLQSIYDNLCHDFVENYFKSKAFVNIKAYSEIVNQVKSFKYSPSCSKVDNHAYFVNICLEELTNQIPLQDIKNKVVTIKNTLLWHKIDIEEDISDNNININNIKINICNKILSYLNITINNNIYDIWLKELDKIFDNIYNQSLLQLLKIPSDFFSNTLQKIQTTTGNEQTETIYEFKRELMYGLPLILEKNQPKILQEIDEILSQQDVAEFLKKGIYFWDLERRFNKEVKKKNKARNLDTFKKAMKYNTLGTKAFCNYWIGKLRQLKASLLAPCYRKSNIIIDKLTSYFRELLNYSSNKLDMADNDIYGYFKNFQNSWNK